MRPEFTRPQSTEWGIDNPVAVQILPSARTKGSKTPARCADDEEAMLFSFWQRSQCTKTASSLKFGRPRLRVLMATYVQCKRASLTCFSRPGARRAPCAGACRERAVWHWAFPALAGSAAHRCRVCRMEHPEHFQAFKACWECSSASVILHAVQCRVRGELGSRRSLKRCACLS